MHSTALHWMSCTVPCFVMPSDTICPMCAAYEQESLFHAAQTREQVHTSHEEMYVALRRGTTKLHLSPNHALKNNGSFRREGGRTSRQMENVPARLTQDTPL